MQPQQTPQQISPLPTPATIPAHKSPKAVLVTTVLFATLGLLMPLGIFAGMFNDTGDRSAAIFTYSVIGGFLATALVHGVSGVIVTRHRATPAAKNLFLADIVLLATMVVAFATYFIGVKANVQQLIMIGFGIFLQLLPVVVIYTFIMSVRFIREKPTMQSQEQPNPDYQQP